MTSNYNFQYPLGDPGADDTSQAIAALARANAEQIRVNDRLAKEVRDLRRNVALLLSLVVPLWLAVIALTLFVALS